MSQLVPLHVAIDDFEAKAGKYLLYIRENGVFSPEADAVRQEMFQAWADLQEARQLHSEVLEQTGRAHVQLIAGGGSQRYAGTLSTASSPDPPSLA